MRTVFAHADIETPTARYRRASLATNDSSVLVLDRRGTVLETVENAVIVPWIDGQGRSQSKKRVIEIDGVRVGWALRICGCKSGPTEIEALT